MVIRSATNYSRTRASRRMKYNSCAEPWNTGWSRAYGAAGQSYTTRCSTVAQRGSPWRVSRCCTTWPQSAYGYRCRKRLRASARTRSASRTSLKNTNGKCQKKYSTSMRDCSNRQDTPKELLLFGERRRLVCSTLHYARGWAKRKYLRGSISRECSDIEG